MANSNIETLEQAQEYLLQEMMDVEKIWGQLNSEAFKKGFNGDQKAYENWRMRAGDAYSHRLDVVKELKAYIQKRWNVNYKTAQELRALITERNLVAPDWLDNGAEQGEISVKVDPMETETIAHKHPEIILSVQSEAALGAILQRLVMAREESGLTMTDAARYFGYTGQAVSNWERGTTPVTLLNIFKLARIYECDPLWILTGESEISREALSEIADGLGVSLSAIWDLIGK